MLTAMVRTYLLLSLACSAMAQDGAVLFTKHCAGCHRGGSETRAPLPDALAGMPREKIAAALASGSMKAQGAALSAPERLAVAAFLSKISGAQTQAAGACAAGAAPFRVTAGAPGWIGWGVDVRNTRYQPADAAGLDREQTARLKLKWAFGIPGVNTALAQPAIAGGRVFFGALDGTVYALDAKTGCVYWTFKASAGVRSAISMEAMGKDKYALYFGDVKANMYAVDAQSGTQIWKVQVDEHPVARVTAAPVLYKGNLYVALSSIEEPAAQNPKYPCCSFRGNVVALESASGKRRWKSYAIPDPPGPTRKNSAGTQLQGPAGAAIWSAPTIDAKRNVLYVGTGNGYSDPPDSHTDAIIAFDLGTGSMKWSRQMTPGDGWNFGCIHPSRTNCPETSGDDLDFGASPVLKMVDGRELLFAGQKSGVVHAVDPNQMGRIVWQHRIGKGGALGGIEWGIAADEKNLYAALSDFNGRKPDQGGGMFALRLATGEKVWATLPPPPACAGKPGCSPAQMGAVTLIPGVVFSGSMDGHIRAYETAEGKIIWDYDTLRDFETVNGVKARGGSLSAGGPAAVDGLLYVNSGYGALAGMPGNVLLAFGPE